MLSNESGFGVNKAINLTIRDAAIEQLFAII